MESKHIELQLRLLEEAFHNLRRSSLIIRDISFALSRDAIKAEQFLVKETNIPGKKE
jgi:hypothetical protein